MESRFSKLNDAGSSEPVRLTSDFVFKYVFGSETSTSILRSFLTAVQTDAGLPAVAEVEIRNPFNAADSYDAKTSVVDVRARDVNGTVYTVEVQALPEAAFRERALYYWAHAYTGQLGKGQDYGLLCPVIGVNVVDFAIFPDSSAVRTTFFLTENNMEQANDTAPNVRDGTPRIVLTDHLAIHFLELPKLQHGSQEPISTSTTLQRWLYYMHERGEVGAMEDSILLQILKEDPEIENAEERYQQFVADEKLREKYQDRIKAERDRRSQIIYAEQQGEKRGLERGLERGREEGREEGRKQGLIEVARKLKKQGRSVDEIVSLTGVDPGEV